MKLSSSWAAGYCFQLQIGRQEMGRVGQHGQDLAKSSARKVQPAMAVTARWYIQMRPIAGGAGGSCRQDVPVWASRQAVRRETSEEHACKVAAAVAVTETWGALHVPWSPPTSSVDQSPSSDSSDFTDVQVQALQATDAIRPGQSLPPVRRIHS